MKIRLITSGVGLVVLALVLFTFDTIFFNMIISCITVAAIHEIYMAIAFEKRDWPLFAVQVPYVFFIMNSDSDFIHSMLLPAAFVMMLFYCVYLVLREGRVSFLRTSGFVCFSGIMIFCFYSLVYLKMLLPVAEFGYDAVFFIMVALCFAWGGDSCAYFAGRFLGKHKLSPVVSPKKTVEGAIGGVFGSMAFGVIATLIYQACAPGRAEIFVNGPLGLPMIVFVMTLAVFASVLGVFGDLFASVVKRQCNIKDYGTVFPGHGGILDRFDSVMFIAPFVVFVIAVTY